MNKYVLSYYGGDTTLSEEENAHFFGKYKAWMENLGEALSDPDRRVIAPKLVSSNGVSDVDTANPWRGFAIIESESMESALKISQKCPFLDIGGSIVVGQLMEMK